MSIPEEPTDVGSPITKITEALTSVTKSGINIQDISFGLIGLAGMGVVIWGITKGAKLVVDNVSPRTWPLIAKKLVQFDAFGDAIDGLRSFAMPILSFVGGLLPTELYGTLMKGWKAIDKFLDPLADLLQGLKSVFNNDLGKFVNMFLPMLKGGDR